MKDMETCVICLNYINNPCTMVPCTHVMCSECMNKCLKYDTHCPICRHGICEIIPPFPINCFYIQVFVYLDKSLKFGFTIQTDLKQQQVVISSFTNKQSVAFVCGLRKKDIILTINGLPCHTLKTTLQILSYMKYSQPIKFCVYRQSSKVNCLTC